MYNYNEKMQAIANYRAMKKEIENELKALESELKNYMQEKNLKELIGTEHIAKLISVNNTRLDTKALKLDYPAIYDKYSKGVNSTRLNFN